MAPYDVTGHTLRNGDVSGGRTTSLLDWGCTAMLAAVARVFS